jgi:membrane associated rhomboid family serine protease
LGGGDALVQHWSVIPADIVAGRHWITILTVMFMQGGWMHIIGNVVFFGALGPEIENGMWPFRYLAFYLLSGFVASIAQIVIDPRSAVPNLGASGAIAGMMGAFLITYPPVTRGGQHTPPLECLTPRTAVLRFAGARRCISAFKSVAPPTLNG